MKKLKHTLLTILFLGGFLGPQICDAQIHTTTLNEEKTDDSSAYSAIKTLVASLQQKKALENELENEKVALEFEQNFTFPSLVKIDEIRTKIKDYKQDIQVLNNDLSLEKSTRADKQKSLQTIEKTLSDEIQKSALGENEFSKRNIKNLTNQKNAIKEEIDLIEGTIEEVKSQLLLKNEEIQLLEAEIQTLEQMYQDRKELQKTNIESAKERILQLEEELARQEAFVKNQTSQVIYDILLLLGIIGILFILRSVSAILIHRFSVNLTPKRKSIILNLNRIIFNVIIGLVVIGIVFSQIVNLLPFIAILSTGLAFAVRDSISCFIGWFVIGTDRGFKVGHIIKVDEVFGRVKDIGPILTRIQDMSGREKTGRMISIPNKFIFEKEIINLSHTYNFTQEEIRFLLTPESDFTKAQQFLETALEKSLENNQSKIKNYQKRIERSAGITHEETRPHVLLKTTPQGPEIRGKFFAEFDTINDRKANIIHHFLKQVHKTDDVEVKYLNY